MKLLLDFLPIVLFFVSFKWAGSNPEQAQSMLEPILGSISNAEVQTAQLPILLATVVAILATVLQIVYQKATGKKVENMQWIGLILIAVFGGATLVCKRNLHQMEANCALPRHGSRLPDRLRLQAQSY